MNAACIAVLQSWFSMWSAPICGYLMLRCVLAVHIYNFQNHLRDHNITLSDAQRNEYDLMIRVLSMGLALIRAYVDPNGLLEAYISSEEGISALIRFMDGLIHIHDSANVVANVIIIVEI